MSKFAIYQALRKALPVRLRHALGGAAVTRWLRDRFFRPGGSPAIVEGDIPWMDLKLSFAAPYQAFYKALHHGVENRICRLARSVLSPGDLALDVGTNYGFVSLVLGHAVRPGGKVVSFEIDEQIRHVLEATLARNQLTDTVTLVPHGAGALCEHGLVTVDSVLETAGDRPVRWLKVDVDGGDYDVLLGARATLEAHHPVVVIEMTEQEQEIYDLLVEVGYDHFIDQSNRAVSPGEWPENLIASCEPVRVPLLD